MTTSRLFLDADSFEPDEPIKKASGNDKWEGEDEEEDVKVTLGFGKLMRAPVPGPKQSPLAKACNVIPKIAFVRNRLQQVSLAGVIACYL